jgi:hypothetical protein
MSHVDMDWIHVPQDMELRHSYEHCKKKICGIHKNEDYFHKMREY